MNWSWPAGGRTTSAGANVAVEERIQRRLAAGGRETNAALT